MYKTEVASKMEISDYVKPKRCICLKIICNCTNKRYEVTHVVGSKCRIRSISTLKAFWVSKLQVEKVKKCIALK